LPALPAGQFVTEFAVENDSTLAVARRLVDQGHHTAVLNFASANHPGGGFLHGARAQEKSLARCSAPYECLVGQPMYDYLRDRDYDPLDSDYALYSPKAAAQRVVFPHLHGILPRFSNGNAKRLGGQDPITF
jgi:uncharacterized protein (TIGR02452 family)